MKISCPGRNIASHSHLHLRQADIRPFPSLLVLPCPPARTTPARRPHVRRPNSTDLTHRFENRRAFSEQASKQALHRTAPPHRSTSLAITRYTARGGRRVAHSQAVPPLPKESRKKRYLPPRYPVAASTSVSRTVWAVCSADSTKPDLARKSRRRPLSSSRIRQDPRVPSQQTRSQTAGTPVRPPRPQIHHPK